MTQNARRKHHQCAARKCATVAAFALVSTIGVLSFGAVDAGAVYHPQVDPALFRAAVDNPFFPLVPGTTYHFTETTDQGVNQNDVAVTRETKSVMGVPCVVVHDTLKRKGRLIEDTHHTPQDELLK